MTLLQSTLARLWLLTCTFLTRNATALATSGSAAHALAVIHRRITIANQRVDFRYLLFQTGDISSNGAQRTVVVHAILVVVHRGILQHLAGQLSQLFTLLQDRCTVRDRLLGALTLTVCLLGQIVGALDVLLDQSGRVISQLLHVHLELLDLVVQVGQIQVCIGQTFSSLLDLTRELRQLTLDLTKCLPQIGHQIFDRLDVQLTDIRACYDTIDLLQLRLDLEELVLVGARQTGLINLFGGLNQAIRVLLQALNDLVPVLEALATGLATRERGRRTCVSDCLQKQCHGSLAMSRLPIIQCHCIRDSSVERLSSRERLSRRNILVKNFSTESELTNMEAIRCICGEIVLAMS